MRGRSRVWIVFSHTIVFPPHNWKGVDMEALFLDGLDQMGRRLDQHIVRGSALYLYDLSVGSPVTGSCPRDDRKTGALFGVWPLHDLLQPFQSMAYG
jgi:hypothetical protein